MHLPAVFACKVLLQLTQSSAIILSSDSSVSCFCWPARCLLYFPSACGASIHGAFTRGLVSAIAGHMESVFDLLMGYYGIAQGTLWQTLQKTELQFTFFFLSNYTFRNIFDILTVTYVNVQSNITVLVFFLDHYNYTGTVTATDQLCFDIALKFCGKRPEKYINGRSYHL